MGLHKMIKDPAILFSLFKQYREAVKSKPILVKDWVGKDADKVDREKERPLTMEGFRVYAFEHYSCIKHYFDNPDGAYDEYRTICSHIKDVIRQDQIEGGMVGQYNPSITQRLNGLKEQTETTITEQPFFKDDV